VTAAAGCPPAAGGYPATCTRGDRGAQGGRSGYPGRPGYPVAGRGPGGVAAEHTCPACTVAVIPASTLMCRWCWPAVPRAQQAAVWRAWDSGRGLGSHAWLTAVHAAIGAVR
jgi:hypothetical protein